MRDRDPTCESWCENLGQFGFKLSKEMTFETSAFSLGSRLAGSTLSANSSLEVACSSINLVRLLSVAGKAQPLPLCSFIHSTHLINVAMLHARTFAQCCGPLIMPALWSEQNCFCTFLWLQFSVEQPCSKHRSQATNNFLPQVWILWPCGPFRCYKHCWHFSLRFLPV